MPTPLPTTRLRTGPGAGCGSQHPLAVRVRRAEPVASSHTRQDRRGASRIWLGICAAIGLLGVAGIATATQVVIPGPAGSQRFGTAVAVLPNGDFVVADPRATPPGGGFQAGAVHHYRPNGTLVATLRGSTSGDLVGEGGIVVLANGNYLVRSPRWDNGTIVDAGAVTFVRGNTGLEGVVSAANSLVGSTANDRVGFTAPVALPNGSYVIVARDWDNGAAVDAGAVVHGRADIGIAGPISAANALVGASAGDRLGFFGIVVLANGNWLASSADFDAGAIVDAGAVTHGSAVTGRVGVVSAANSLIGASASDRVGSVPPVPLANGNYVVRVPDWDNGSLADAGAVAFGQGSSGTAGTLGPGNALVGSSASDRVGNGGVTPLPAGGYLVGSPNWRNGGVANAGALSFGNGSTGIVGPISASNSLVGASANDRIGDTTPLVLANGNWAIGSPFWDNGALADAGAVTFGFGTTGRTGTVATTNSLVGSNAGDRVGEQMLALVGADNATIGRYVVLSQRWRGSAGLNVGAVTVLAGTGGVSGAVSTLNSLVGSQSSDFVGSGGAFALADGRFVVASPLWNNGATLDVGAVTLRESLPLANGVVSTANSLFGATAGDEVGSGGVVPLPNSAYLVLSPKFTPGTATGAGAVTWAPAASGRTGTVSAANSLVGSSLLDNLGSGPLAVTVLDDGDAVLASPFWNNGAIDDAGAVTWIDRDSGRTGAISALNSLVGGSQADAVGFNGVIALPGGDYLVRSVGWRNGAAANAGAVSFGTDGGTTGVVSPLNSIVGSTANDGVGADITRLPDGNFVVRSNNWDNGATVDAGAFTLGLASGEVAGPLTATHSVLGTVANGGLQSVVGYDPARRQMVVGQPLANRVVLQRAGVPMGCGAQSQAPNPSDLGAAVTFDTFVSGTGAGQFDGRLTVRASNGQQCNDTTGTPLTPNTLLFSCSIAFNQEGTFAILAEFTGSATFTYCGVSAPLPQSVISVIFRSGFE